MRVGVALNKWYDQMYGVQVDIWADTGEIRNIQEAWSTLPPPEGTPVANMSAIGGLTSHISNEKLANVSSNQTFAVTEGRPNILTGITLFTVALSVGGIVLFVVVRQKKVSTYALKSRSPKIGGLLIIVLLLTIALAPLATVAATTRAGVVWGSESTGAGYYPDSWRKYYVEVDWQREAGSVIASYFNDGGYTGYDNQGDNGYTSEKQDILDQLSTLQQSHDYVAAVVFDHGNWLAPGYPTLFTPPGEHHWLFEDNIGTYHDGDWHAENAVYDMEIYSCTQGTKINFAFINTCESANIDDQAYIDWDWPPYPARARGMPLAWTHHFVTSEPDSNPPSGYISRDGYNSPDTGSQVYIGFPWGSASLMQDIPYQSSTLPYFYWVNWFFYRALNYEDNSVKQALDSASWNFYYSDFGDSPLHDGFTAYWWPNMTGEGSTMAVYGNANIHLYQYETDYVSRPTLTGPATGDPTVQSDDFSATAIDPSGHQIRYIFDWGDSTTTETGNYNSGDTASASHNWENSGIYNVKVQAICENEVHSSWSATHEINIGNVVIYHYLTVEAYSSTIGTGYPLYPAVYVDNNYVGTAPVTVPVQQGWHDIEVDYWVWNPYLSCDTYYDHLSSDDGHNAYGGSWIPIYYDMYSQAWYNP